MLTSVIQQNFTNLLRYGEKVFKISERVIADSARIAFSPFEQDVQGLEGGDHRSRRRGIYAMAFSSATRSAISLVNWLARFPNGSSLLASVASMVCLRS